MFNTKQSGYITVHRGQKHFMFSPDGISVVPRAHCVILPQCPQEYRDIINFCLAKGYLQPAANLKDEEHMWEDLKS